MSDAEEQPGAEPVVATITLTRPDITAGLVEASVVLRMRWACLAIILLMNAVLWRSGGVYSDGGWTEGLIVVGFALYTIVMPWLGARRQLAHLTRAGDANVTYRFDEEGLTTRSAGATSSVAYRRIVKVRQGKKSLLIYETDQVAGIVPLRAFSADELARIQAFLPAAAKAKRQRSGTRLVILWFALVMAFMVVWQFLSNTAPSPKPAPREADSPAAG
jgi:hypothetical protein